MPICLCTSWESRGEVDGSALHLLALPWPLLLPPATASLVLFSLLSVLSHTKIVVKGFLPVTKKNNCVLLFFFAGSLLRKHL